MKLRWSGGTIARKWIMMIIEKPIYLSFCQHRITYQGL